MTDPINVAVNLLWLAPGRVGGSEQYLTRQLAGLPTSAELSVTLYCQSSLPPVYPDLSHRFATAVLPTPDWRGLRMAAEYTWLAAKTRDVDLVHHGGGTAPLVGRCPIVLTVHDLQYRTNPGYFSKARLAYLRAVMPASIRRASVITVPSVYVRGTVLDAYPVDADRVIVVPHGVPDIAVPSTPQIAVARRTIGFHDRPYVIYPAITHPHKQHHVLIDMLRHLPDEIGLVLIGGEGSAESDLQRAIRAAGLESRVVRPGRVAEPTRDALIAGAAALVFPSEYEGFGAPLVEAMAIGTPVVCSSSAAVTEVVGEAAVVVAGADGAAWGAGVESAIARHDQLVAAGRQRRSLFTIEHSGAALIDAYRLASGGGR